MVGIKPLITFILDIFYPVKCVGCGQIGDFLCQKCFSSISVNWKFLCPMCGHSSFLGRVCFNCVSHTSLTGVWAVSDYHHEVLQKAIKAFKYNYIKELANPLAELIIAFINNIKLNSIALFDYDFIIPVPLHRKKLLEREFNQSEILARLVSHKFNLPLLTEVIIRRRNTQPQVRLKGAKRQKNLKGAFDILEKNKRRLLGQKILIIDDVYTTGATLNECANVLKKAGVKEIWGLVLAKG